MVRQQGMGSWPRPKGVALLRSIFFVPRFLVRVRLILQRRAQRAQAAHTKEFTEVIDLYEEMTRSWFYPAYESMPASIVPVPVYFSCSYCCVEWQAAIPTAEHLGLAQPRLARIEGHQGVVRVLQEPAEGRDADQRAPQAHAHALARHEQARSASPLVIR